MLAGSFASTYHGDPRTTNDIDLVIDPTREALEGFVRGLADLILRKDRPFSRAEFERRQPAEIAGVVVFVATAEDTIVAKLEWARAGESERQLRDVIGILEVSGERLDRD
jgi:hypothetical protein